MPGAPELSVVVFAYNEAANVPAMLRELRTWLGEHEPSAEIVFVDDGSTDDSRARAEAALEGCAHRIAGHEVNRGIGRALKTGVRESRAPWVTFMPADGQIPPEAIGALRRAARQERADIVFSVYDHRDDGLSRRILSWGVRALIRLVHGVRLHSDGPYLFRRELFVAEDLPPDTFFLNFEFPILALLADTPSAVVTIECRPRMSGRSKSADWRNVARVARDLLSLRMRRSLR